MGDFKHTDFGRIILACLPCCAALECALEPTREAVREAHDAFKDADVELDTVLRSTAEYGTTLNTPSAPWQVRKTRRNLENPHRLFSDNARAIFEEFEFGNTVIGWKAGLLYRFARTSPRSTCTRTWLRIG